MTEMMQDPKGRLYSAGGALTQDCVPSFDEPRLAPWTLFFRRFRSRILQARCLASFDAIIDALEEAMRTTVALDDDLIRTAQEFTGVVEKTALLREALKALIERESARRLASLGGTMPGLKNISRRRPRKH